MEPAFTKSPFCSHAVGFPSSPIHLGSLPVSLIYSSVNLQITSMYGLISYPLLQIISPTASGTNSAPLGRIRASNVPCTSKCIIIPSLVLRRLSQALPTNTVQQQLLQPKPGSTRRHPLSWHQRSGRAWLERSRRFLRVLPWLIHEPSIIGRLLHLRMRILWSKQGSMSS